jgi:hypothetical protein
MEIAEISQFVTEFCNKNLPKVTPLGFEEWLDSTTYTEGRKAQLREVHDSLKGGPPTARQCSHVDTFGKAEGYPEYKNIRLINARSDAFKAWSGPMFKAMENAVYKLDPFIKHTPVPERPQRIMDLKQAGRKYYQTDFTSFESHFTPQIMNAIECALYRHCLANYPGDAAIICRTLMGENRLRTRTGVKIGIKGRRMSGDMCTSLGNGFTNYMLAAYLCHKQGAAIYGFVEGDDGLFATEATLTREMYLKLGFNIKIEEVDDPCHASFCGMIFAQSAQIIKDPKKFMGTFGWTTSFINAGTVIMMGLLRSKALSAVYETPQCPILGAMARRALIVTKGYAIRVVNDGYNWIPRDTLAIPAFNPSADTRQLFADKFGISISAQLEIERRVMLGDYSIGDILTPPSDQLHYSSRYIERG